MKYSEYLKLTFIENVFSFLHSFRRLQKIAQLVCYLYFHGLTEKGLRATCRLDHFLKTNGQHIDFSALLFIDLVNGYIRATRR